MQRKDERSEIGEEEKRDLKGWQQKRKSFLMIVCCAVILVIACFGAGIFVTPASTPTTSSSSSSFFAYPSLQPSTPTATATPLLLDEGLFSYREISMMLNITDEERIVLARGDYQTVERRVAVAEMLAERGCCLFYSEGCWACEWQEEIFGPEAFAQLWKFDCENISCANVVQAHQIQAYPTWMLTTEDGEGEMLEGVRSLPELEAWVKEVRDDGNK